MDQKSIDLFNRAKQVTPGGVHSPVRSFSGLETTPIFFEQAQGAFLKGLDGKEYIDFCQSFGPMLLGHRDEEVQEKVLEVFNKAWTFGACEPYSLELAEWMTSNISWLENVRFVNSGTEAVMSALRLAKGYTGRSKILKFDGCYHGHVDSMLVNSGSGLAGVGNSSSEGVSEAVASETLVAPLDNEEAVNELFTKYGNDIAAIIIEPLPANYGLLKQRKEFLSFLANKAKENGSLLIFDEVISGFRVAIGGMAEVTDITPDLVTYGKIIGGGFPVGCFGGKAEIMSKIAPLGGVYQAGTLSGNPVCMVAGLTTLKKIKRDNIIEKINTRASNFAKEINSFIDEKGLNWQCIQEASLFWLTSKTDEPIRNISQLPSQHKDNFNSLFYKLVNEGIYIAPAAFEVGFLSNAHTDVIMDKTLTAFKKALI